MFSNPQKFNSATQAMLASQVEALQHIGNKAAEGVEKAVALNITAVKASMANSIAVAQQLSTVKDPQAFFSLSAEQARPAAEAATSYGREMTEIAAGMWAEFMNVAEAQFAANQSQATAPFSSSAAKAVKK
jgi:phasin family protein